MSGPESPTPSMNLGKLALQPAAMAYGLGAYLRLCAYARGILKQARATVPVISVGNITVGGTGKTPVTIEIANKLKQAGYKPCVLSRGYKRRSHAPYVVVSDGTATLASCRDAGDEPYLIAAKCPGTVVIVGAKRTLTAQIATEKYGCDVILLDDGFQHLAIARDLDLVLIDYNHDLAGDALLPAGRLREPYPALARSTAILITKIPVHPDHKRLENIGKFLHKHSPHASIGLVRFQSQSLIGLPTEKEKEEISLNDHEPVNQLAQDDISKIAGKRVLAFCALARPQAFFQSLSPLKVTVAGNCPFPDHHWYTKKDLEKLESEAKRLSCDFLLTTEKDLVKLLEFQDALCLPVLALSLSVNFVGEQPVYLNELLAVKRAGKIELSPGSAPKAQTMPNEFAVPAPTTST